ncbi:hypothetical protein BDQ17DRAFT_1388399 [Cyathus striatus]|nr:hypothetical protein BDQ17DRAFT_1388399 [Cyathus striatus]
MYSFFGDESKRKINLGGSHTSLNSRTLIAQAQAERDERSRLLRKQHSATKIFAFWRGVKERRRVKRELKNIFENDVRSLDAMRCLVLMGCDEEVLGLWSKVMVEDGEYAFFQLSKAYGSSWLVLIRQISILLLQAIARSPLSPNTANHVHILTLILSSRSPAPVEIQTYLIKKHSFYSLLQITLQSLSPKSSFPFADLISLLTVPFTVLPPTDSAYTEALIQFLTCIIPIPSLPSLIPLNLLPKFVSRIPFTQLSILDGHIDTVINGLKTPEDKAHFVGTLYLFMSPRYSSGKADATAVGVTVRMWAGVMNCLAPESFDTPAYKEKKEQAIKREDDMDIDDNRITVSVVSSFVPSISVYPEPKLDTKTLGRLAKLASPAHLKSLFAVTQKSTEATYDVVLFLLALERVNASARDDISRRVLVYAPWVVRDLWRGWVRGGGIGGSEIGEKLFETRNSPTWPALLLLVELYSQALQTMGDDEFFSSSPSHSSDSMGYTLAASSSSSTTGSALGSLASSSSSSARNPLTLDDLTTFSKQLLNIAFVLYWKEDSIPDGIGADRGLASGGVKEREVGVRISWEEVRERARKCLVGIHARDSRRPFVPPDHWLITSQIDVTSFVEAAVFEERKLTNPSAAPHHYPKAYFSALTPRLSILNNIPFALPFSTRVSIFRHFVANDMMSHGYSLGTRGWRLGMMGGGRHQVMIRRGSVAEDGFNKLSEADLKGQVEITFVDQFGEAEAGIDGGGVFKEFLTSLAKEVFDTDRGLWLATKKHELYPNPHSYATESHNLNWYRFIGRILGKALYDGILVDVAFSGFFLAKWLGKQNFLDDLNSLDPELYNGLIFLKHYPGNPEDLALNFTVAIEELGVTKSVDLIPNGSNIAVTRENKLQYITLVSHYRLSKQIKKQSEAFFEGLSEIIDPKWLRMFNQQEVQILLGGVNTEIDLDDLRANTNYGGLYDDNSPTIQLFWKVVKSLDEGQRRALLRFATSCSRPPLLGFKELVPNFCIRDSGTDENRLPTASTCVNLLKLPLYKNERVLRQKLMQAINSGAGFDLS